MNLRMIIFIAIRRVALSKHDPLFLPRIHMCTNCAPLLADLILLSYEADLIQRLLNEKGKEASRIL
jgi:hypothetical protein